MATAKEKAAERAARRAATAAEAAAAGEPTEVEQLNQKQFVGQSAHPASGPMLPQTRTRQYVVGCKLGVRSYAIQHTRMVETFEQNQSGGRTVKIPERVGAVVELRGTSYPRGTVPDGFPPPPMIVEGAALNFGIDADWFDEWLEQNKQNPIVMNKMVFAHEKQDWIISKAKELKDLKSGLDPVNPKGDPRMPKSNRGEISDIERGDRKAG